MTIPFWAIGLVAAGAAPFVVRAVADALEARAKKRTERAIRAAADASRDRNA
jgi:type II secretory pathway pseudopilin PulG